MLLVVTATTYHRSRSSESPMRPSISAGVPRQAGVRKNLHVVVSSPVAWTLEDEERSQETWSHRGFNFVDEGGKNTGREKEGYP